jgi:flagellar hook assembly protein FlgD
MTIEIENPSLKKTTVEIFSMSGQKIKTLLRAQKGAKINCTWNGRDESGKQLPGGMYLLKVNGEIRKVVKR